jgi:hypothetical protein
MSENTKEIFEQFAEKVVPELREVSKRFADSIEYVATENSLVITGDPHIGVLVNGRPPTSSNPEIGPKSLQQIILEWIPTKNITPQPDDRGRIPTVEQLSWAISKSIHMKGDLLYQRGGRSDIFDAILSQDRINSLLSLIGDRYFASVDTINLGKVK